MIKVLFVTAVGDAKSYDYLTDGILHGLKTQKDKFDVYECFGMKHLYKNYSVDDSPVLFGRRNLNDKPNELDLDMCIKMVADKFFDMIVFDWRTSNEFWNNHGHCPYWKETITIRNVVFSAYSKEKIVFLDSSDDNIGKYEMFTQPFVGKSTYFKRELYIDDPHFHPIDIPFAAEKGSPLILSDAKEKYLAHVIPEKKDTYIFKDESSYYGDYANSYFGATWKKIGWGCYRHSEIVFASCVPLFPDIADCPKRTLTFFPKNLFQEVLDRGVLRNTANKIQKYSDMYIYENIQIDESSIDKSWYDDILSQVYDHSHKNLTTTAMANYVVSKLNI